MASLKNAINALIAGQSKPIRRAQRSLRFDPADLPPTDKYGTIQSVAATA